MIKISRYFILDFLISLDTEFRIFEDVRTTQNLLDHDKPVKQKFGKLLKYLAITDIEDIYKEHSKFKDA